MSTVKFISPKSSQDGYQQAHAKHFAHALLTSHVLKKASEEPDRPLRVLSFPGTSFQWERSLHLSVPGGVVLTGLESKPDIYAKGLTVKSALELPIDHRLTDDLDFWRTEDQQQDVIWLDYCGPWSKRKAASIAAMFSQQRLRFGPSGPLLAVTLMDGMDLQSMGDLMLLANARTRQFKARVGGIPKWIDETARQHGCSAELKFLLHYRDGYRNRNATPMLLFILQLHNRIVKFDVWKAETMDLIQEHLAGMVERVKR